MLPSKFDIKDLRYSNFILGIKILTTSQGLGLSKFHYIQMVLKKFGYLNFKVVKMPDDMNLTLVKNKGKSKSQLDYTRGL